MVVALAGVLGVAMYGPLVTWPLDELVATREARAALALPTRAVLASWMAPMASLPLIGMWMTATFARLDAAQRRALYGALTLLSWGALCVWTTLVQRALGAP